MRNERIILNGSRNVSLDIYVQDENGEIVEKNIRPAILILPGGAYKRHDLKEADTIALAYLNKGFQSFVLRYSVGEFAIWPNPLEDYELAMRYLLDNAQDLNFDKTRISVIGFSAGGHLALSGTIISKLKPRALILGYPAIIKDTISFIMPNVIDPLEINDNSIPPVFIFHTRNDELVDINNTLEIQNYLYRNNINFESHIYSYGAHGFSLGNSLVIKSDISERVKNWFDDSISWLDEVWGKLTRLGYGDPKYLNRVNDDLLDHLTCECTIKRINKNSDACKYLQEELNVEFNPIFENMKLSSLLKFIKKEDLKEKLNKALSAYQ